MAEDWSGSRHSICGTPSPDDAQALASCHSMLYSCSHDALMLSFARDQHLKESPTTESGRKEDMNATTQGHDALRLILGVCHLHHRPCPSGLQGDT